MNNRLKVLIVDDSAFFRRRIAEMLEEEQAIEVVGVAENGHEAVEQNRLLRPDVITMDVEMPVMDGITAVKTIMAEQPTPILMFSSLTQEGARATFEALDAGALDFLPKQFYSAEGRKAAAEVLIKRVLAIGQRHGKSQQRVHAGVIKRSEPKAESTTRAGAYKLVAIGASTGGPVAVQKLLSSLPAGFELPILVVVHMPGSFTTAYAERLNMQCSIAIKEARDGDRLEAGQAYVAPGGYQVILERQNQEVVIREVVIRIVEGDGRISYRPSVDVSFGSAARLFTDKVLAIVLTGMGADGKQAAKLLKEGGSTVWSQDEESCVVYGMPQSIEKAGLSDRVLPLDDIGPALSKVV
ncbi:protein-glutamate methylesterase/protein-glutamine glutaminase [Solemya velesiana gill symbiont]|uniref:Protein-glutamate methylesterase/protein-glutamine glutaminase n=1 Tax=Solemya velesiana gill symbiont TaxID=1918948 RepID=A0A1T2KWP3_9GAMM|nr:chemotaxis response regulator protein-glutamate methylesterase [Solemya velesiana gill symbiont]OOZ37242.1 chemotaxis response regulator protein-glutamate methylesterase [Solemya velesiana gill symbiont]